MMDQRHFLRPQLPSTSTANSDGAEPSKFESRREKYAAKMLFAERKFNELKMSKLFQARKAQIEKRRDAIRRRTCPHFMRLKLALDNEFNEKKKKLDTARALRLHAVERCREAEQIAAERNLRENETAVVRQQCEQMIERKFEQFRTETNAVEEILRNEFCHSNLAKSGGSKFQKTNVPGGHEPLLNKYLFEVPSNGAGNGVPTSKRQWRNVPAVIAQLPQHCIDDDLTKAFWGERVEGMCADGRRRTD
ncbi:hypothetical protein GPALN_005055 [Globodera pallida]|nr:hypothetical protein GPALN_005055 [Globodera pallida]